eukprot:m.25075 g.25075  ORF g.25075 m.25075 type:complete len:446 (-) comp8676_c1_seq2:272-1609(-)
MQQTCWCFLATTSQYRSAPRVGITDLTLVRTKKGRRGHHRSVSWANVELEPMMVEQDDATSDAVLDGNGDDLSAAARSPNPFLSVPGISVAQSESDPRFNPLSVSLLRETCLEDELTATRPRANSDSHIQVHRRGKPIDRHKTLAYWKLEKELRLVKDKLMAKAEECESLEQYKERLEKEVDDLATSLFEEAHDMVHQANDLRAKAEKRCAEATSKIDVLSAEVQALKDVIAHMRQQQPPQAHTLGTSTPVKSPRKPDRLSMRFFRKKQDPVSQVSEPQEQSEAPPQPLVDQVEFQLFRTWYGDKSLQGDFVKGLEQCEMIPTLQCKPVDQQTQVQSESGNVAHVFQAIQKNTLCIEKLSESSAAPTCPYLPQYGCEYRMRLTPDAKEWTSISASMRNRIVTVTDCHMFLQYINKGLVTSSPEEAYHKLCKHRKSMFECRLGLGL